MFILYNCTVYIHRSISFNIFLVSDAYVAPNENAGVRTEEMTPSNELKCQSSKSCDPTDSHCEEPLEETYANLDEQELLAEDPGNSYPDVMNTILFEGAPREEDALPEDNQCTTKLLDKKQYIKQRRNSGEDYHSEKSGKYMPQRKLLKSPCSSDHCLKMNFSCGLNEITEDQRKEILYSFWESGTLSSQRQYIVHHVSSPCNTSQKDKKNKNWFIV